MYICPGTLFRSRYGKYLLYIENLCNTHVVYLEALSNLTSDLYTSFSSQGTTSIQREGDYFSFRLKLVPKCGWNVSIALHQIFIYHQIMNQSICRWYFLVICYAQEKFSLFTVDILFRSIRNQCTMIWLQTTIGLLPYSHLS